MGRVTFYFAAALLVPFAAALYWHESFALTAAFLFSAVFSALLGSAFTYHARHHFQQLTLREGVFFMTLVWPLAGFIGMLPFWLSGALPDFTTAFFEGISALTTTGLTDFGLIDGERAGVPQSLLLWRSLLSWLGGLSFVMILVTVLPHVSGCFGMTLTARQMIYFSPVWNRMRTSMRQGAAIYAVVTLLAILLFLLAGLKPFLAVTQAFFTISSGGGPFFSFSDYNSPALELATGFVMILSCVNLLLCWKAWDIRRPLLLLQDTELRVFFFIALGAGAILSLHFAGNNVMAPLDAVRCGFFDAVSFLSTNGYFFGSMDGWSDFDRMMLLSLPLIGGCMGSAAGGIKVLRIMILMKISWAGLRQTLHPHMVVSIRLDGLPVAAKIVGRILSYFFLYFVAFAVFSLVLSLSDMSLMQAMSLTVGCLTSTGATAALYGIADLSAFPDWVRFVCSLLMILGRIEIFSFLVFIELISRHTTQRHW